MIHKIIMVTNNSKRISILVLHGPNLNLLGKRESKIYGSISLKEVNILLNKKALALRIRISIVQSNHEGTIVELIHQSLGQHQGILINAGAYTHTSLAIADACLAVEIPVVEVHLSNIYKREHIRHYSHIAPISIGQITGFGVNSYLLGLEALYDYLCQ